jgi:hypothetical protein
MYGNGWLVWIWVGIMDMQSNNMLPHYITEMWYMFGIIIIASWGVYESWQVYDNNHN